METADKHASGIGGVVQPLHHLVLRTGSGTSSMTVMVVDVDGKALGYATIAPPSTSPGTHVFTLLASAGYTWTGKEYGMIVTSNTVRTFYNYTGNVTLNAGGNAFAAVAPTATVSTTQSPSVPVFTLGNGQIPLGVANWQSDAALLRMVALLSGGVTVAPPSVQVYTFLSDGTDELLISATARKCYGLYVFHVDATPVHIKLYDKATAPDENDTPIFPHGVLANSTAALGATSNCMFAQPVDLTNGLGVRGVTGIADNNDAALTSSEVRVAVLWSV